MKICYFYIVLLLFPLAASIPCFAQQGAESFNDSQVVKRIIFKDDFSDDTVGKPPAKWRIPPVTNDEPDNRKYCTVQKANNMNVLSVTKNVAQCFDPIINSGSLRSDSLSIAFDFLLENINSIITVGICSGTNTKALDKYCSELLFQLENEDNEGITLRSTCWEDKYFKTTKAGHFSAVTWHRFNLTFDNGTIRCVIDQHVVSTFPQTGYFPTAAYFCFFGSLEFTNVRIASISRKYPVGKILTENKFVSHAIRFNTNQSTIMPESFGMIIQLAQFLEANPAVRLEIDGHTDSDGSPAANIKLSQDRADEVKKQLVLLGVNATRLTAKGFGAAVPIQPNTTPDGKAENRRVEFIRQ